MMSTQGKDANFSTYFLPKAAGDGLGNDAPLAFRVKSIDRESRRITAAASSEIVDRDGEVVSIAALKKAVKAYMANPVILASHQHRLDDGHSPVVGKVVDYRFVGKEFLITVEFADTELGMEYWKLYRDKFQRAFSIGFKGLDAKEEYIDGRRVRVFTVIELYEISCVAVPANPAALSKNFVQQKRFEREVQKVLADDTATIRLLESKADAFMVGQFDDLTTIEIEVFKREGLDDSGWGFGEDSLKVGCVPLCEGLGLDPVDGPENPRSLVTAKSGANFDDGDVDFTAYFR